MQAGLVAGDPSPAKQQATVLYDFVPEHDNELSLAAGEFVEVLSQETPEWTFVRAGDKEGYVPANYIKLFPPPAPPPRQSSAFLAPSPPRRYGISSSESLTEFGVEFIISGPSATV
jgi:myosin-1